MLYYINTLYTFLDKILKKNKEKKNSSPFA